MSAAILFSGSLASKVLRFLDIFGTEHIARSTHFGHQKNVPACHCAFCVEKQTKQKPAGVEGKGWPSCAGDRRWLGQPWPFSQTGWLQHAGLCHKEGGGCPGCAGL